MRITLQLIFILLHSLPIGLRLGDEKTATKRDQKPCGSYKEILAFFCWILSDDCGLDQTVNEIGPPTMTSKINVRKCNNKKKKKTNKKNQKQLRFQWRRCSSKRLSVILMQPGISSHTRSDTWLICQTVNWPVNKIHVRPCRSQKEREKTKHNKQQVWGLCWDIDDKRLLQAPGAWKLRSSKMSIYGWHDWQFFSATATECIYSQ